MTLKMGMTPKSQLGSDLVLQELGPELSHLELPHLAAPRQRDSLRHTIVSKPENVCRRLMFAQLAPDPVPYLVVRRHWPPVLLAEEGAYNLSVVRISETNHDGHAHGRISC